MTITRLFYFVHPRLGPYDVWYDSAWRTYDMTQGGEKPQVCRYGSLAAMFQSKGM